MKRTDDIDYAFKIFSNHNDFLMKLTISESKKTLADQKPKKYSINDILGMIPGSGEEILYQTNKRLEGEYEAIQKKYGFGCYYSPSSLISKYDKEVHDFHNIYPKEADVIIKHVTITHKIDQYSEQGGKFKAKIYDKTGISETTGKFLKHVEEYGKKLNEYFGKISKSINITEADKVAAEMQVFHDTNTNNLYTETTQILKDFEVLIAGVVPDQGN